MRENEWIAFAKTAIERNGIESETIVVVNTQIESDVQLHTHFPHFVHSKHISWFRLRSITTTNERKSWTIYKFH